MSASLITRAQVIAAVAQRNTLAAQIRAYCPHLSFEQCMKLCGTPLLDRYLAANRVACFLEQEVFGIDYHATWSTLEATAGEDDA